MGLIYSYLFRRKFVVNNEVEGQDESAAEIFRLLGLMPTDVDLLYTVFWDIDADSSGLIRPLELFSYFEVEGTKFEYGVFSLFDEDKFGMINFMEFVCTLWNLLTLPESDFGSVAYLLRDPSGQAEITFFDVREIMEMMHNKRVDRDPALHAVYNQLKKDMNTRLSIRKFTDWTAAHSAVTAPILMLQLHIRLQIIGEPFWQRMSNERASHPEQGKLDYVKKLQSFVMEKNRMFRDKAMIAERERLRLSRLGMGAAGDRRNNVERRQSRLLSYFNLKHDPNNNKNKNRGKSLSRVFNTDDLDTSVVRESKSSVKKAAAENSKEEDGKVFKVKAKPAAASNGNASGSARQSMKVTANNSNSQKEEVSPSSKKDKQRNTIVSTKSSSNSPTSAKRNTTIVTNKNSSSSPLTVSDGPSELSEPSPDKDNDEDNKERAIEEKGQQPKGPPGRPRRSSLLQIKPAVVREKASGKEDNKIKTKKNKSNNA